MEQIDFKKLAVDAYLYAYPIVIMEMTRRQVTNVPDATTALLRAPINQFSHGRDYPVADSRDVVRFNFDTLYSFAWLDLREEPMVVTLPDAPERYHLTPMVDMWTDVFAVPGTRTTQGKGMNCLVAAPGWHGEVPEGLELIVAPTPNVWVMGRILSEGTDDLPAVHKVQDQYRITPLSSWGSSETTAATTVVDPSIDSVTPPLEQVNALSSVEFFKLFAELLKSNPPHSNDYPILHRISALGLVPGEDFDFEALGGEAQDAILEARDSALKTLVSAMTDGSAGFVRNHWNWEQNFGTYGTSYKLRALVAMAGLGANLPEDAIYPNAISDSEGNLLSGENNYVLHFDKGQQPSVDAFWSLTMYDDEGFQVPNPLERFVIRDRDPLILNPDGSLDIYIQHESPGAEREANWLSAPRGKFAPMLRLYSPTEVALSPAFVPPALTKV